MNKHIHIDNRAHDSDRRTLTEHDWHELMKRERRVKRNIRLLALMPLLITIALTVAAVYQWYIH